MIRTTIMADEETLQKLDRIAQRKGTSKAAVIREALAEYITEQETAEPFDNPLLALIGLAGDDAVDMDLSDGQDEQYLREKWVNHLDRSP
jgi:metal-responsive CopG/Arc/MetJ family transcriptional regulator